MYIETYSDKYYLDVINIVENFHNEALSQYNDIFDRNTLADTIMKLKDQNSQNAFLLIVNNKCEGILAGMEIPSLYNKKRIFQELVWYINKPFRMYGVALLKHVERLLRESGFNTIIMSVMENSKTDKIKALYNRMGFQLFESHYIRSL